MIKIKEIKKSNKKKTPHYLLVFNYMIGDADGYNKEKVRVGMDNPYVERFCKLLNKLKPLEGSWGICFRDDELEEFLKQKQITKDDYDFLNQTMYEQSEEEVETGPLEEKYLIFYEGIKGETNYSFLVFQGIEILYYDEFGIQHETEFK